MKLDLDSKTTLCLGGAFAAGLLTAVVLSPNGDEVHQTFQIDMPQVDAAVAAEISNPEMQALRSDLLRCGLDFTISAENVEDVFQVKYDVSAMSSNSRECLEELNENPLNSLQNGPEG